MTYMQHVLCIDFIFVFETDESFIHLLGCGITSFFGFFPGDVLDMNTLL